METATIPTLTAGIWEAHTGVLLTVLIGTHGPVTIIRFAGR